MMEIFGRHFMPQPQLRGSFDTPALFKSPVMPTTLPDTENGLPQQVSAQLANGLKHNAFTPQAVANRVIDFVQRAIDSRASDATDAGKLIAQARDGVRQGIDEARELLQGMAALSQDVDAQITETEALIFAGLDELAASESQPGSQAISLSPVAQQLSSQYQLSRSYQQQQTAAIEIVTQDGDRIEISYSAEYQEALSVSKSLQLGEGGFSAESQQFIYQSQQVAFELSVQGELDEGERDALEELMKDLGKVASQFYDGNLRAAFRSAMKLEMDTDELKSLSVEFQQSQQLQQVEQYRRVAESFAETPLESESTGPAEVVDAVSQLQQLWQRIDEHLNSEDSINQLKRLLLEMVHDTGESEDSELDDYIDTVIIES